MREKLLCAELSLRLVPTQRYSPTLPVCCLPACLRACLPAFLCACLRACLSACLPACSVPACLSALGFTLTLILSCIATFRRGTGNHRVGSGRLHQQSRPMIPITTAIVAVFFIAFPCSQSALPRLIRSRVQGRL